VLLLLLLLPQRQSVETLCTGSQLILVACRHDTSYSSLQTPLLLIWRWNLMPLLFQDGQSQVERGHTCHGAMAAMHPSVVTKSTPALLLARPQHGATSSARGLASVMGGKANCML
jgi:hypothetical protein